MPRKPEGKRPLTTAERQARFKRRQAAFWDSALDRLRLIADGMERGEISREECAAMVHALRLEMDTIRGTRRQT